MEQVKDMISNTIPEFKAEDFLLSSAPYEWLYKYKKDAFEHERMLTLMCSYAKSVGVSNFKKLYAQYTTSLKQAIADVYVNNATDFSGQPLELDAGDWQCDDYGVSIKTGFGEEQACYHPIMPVERLVNIDTGEEKVVLAYSKGKKWRTVVVSKDITANANKITQLAARGIAVTSENSRLMVRYLSDIESLNYERIPEHNSVTRLGYIKGEGFSPYVDNLVFDGDLSFKNLYQSVSSAGDFEKWIETAQECRADSISAKIILAASFASVLVQPLNTLPFFVHLWGVDSGTGKTVGLMLAASVWGNPERGQYVQTFNATEVGHERLAAFLNSLPMCIDELQLAKDKRGNTNFNIYSLAQGVGRTRGNKSGGLDITPTWGNCILTTGESPLAVYSDGAGALNRVIEIECKSDCKVISNGIKVSGTLKKNYGFAGRKFIETLTNNPQIDILQSEYNRLFAEFQSKDATEKQAMAAALIVLADKLATTMFFDDKPLTVDEVSEFLKTASMVSLGQRGYDFLCGWISQNVNRFNAGEENTGEVFGIIEEDKAGVEWAFINAKKFRDVVESEGISSQSLLSWLKEKRLIKYTDIKGNKHNTVQRRIKNTVTRCIALQLPTEEFVNFDEYDTVL
jgi:uncharacterized protein (DUF927 family)